MRDVSAGLVVWRLFSLILIMAATAVGVSAAEVTADHERFALHLHVNPSESGEVGREPQPGLDGLYSSGTLVRLRAFPRAGFAFHSWTGDASGASTTTTVAMTAPREITANFHTQEPAARYPLAVHIFPAESGEVGLDPRPGLDGKYPAGTIVHLRAFPRTGHAFAYWEGAASGLATTCTVTMNGSRSVTAYFRQVEPAPRHTLTVHVSPAEGGEVGLDPRPGTDGKYPAGTVVHLRAHPRSGYAFAYWAGAAAGTATSTTITMNGFREVTAYFRHLEPAPRYSLAVAVQPPGSGEVARTPLPGPDGKYAAGTIVQLRAFPHAGFAFASWSGAAAGTATTTTVAMNGNREVSANFREVEEQPRYQLAVHVQPGESGEVALDPRPGLDGRYPAGTVVRLRAFARSGYAFVSWSGAASGTATTASVAMLGNREVVATFRVVEAPVRYALVVTVQPTGSGEVALDPRPGSDGKYPAGAVVHLRAFPRLGYAFASWSGDASGTSVTATVAMTTNRHVTANFRAVEPAPRYGLAVAIQPPDGGEVARDPLPGPDGKYAAGTSVRLRAVPRSGFAFVAWSGEASGSATTTTVVMSENREVVANFRRLEQPARFILAVHVDPPGSGAVILDPPPAADGKYSSGTLVHLRGVAHDGFTFQSWSGAASGSNDTAAIVMSGNREVTAFFQEIDAGSHVRAVQGLRVLSGGEWYNVLFYNYTSESITAVDLSNTSAIYTGNMTWGVPDTWNSCYLYDYAAGHFTSAVILHATGR